MTTLLFTHTPHADDTKQGIEFIQNFCENWQKNQPTDNIALNIFLYSEAVHLANRLAWLPDDTPNPIKIFQNLLKHYQLTAQVCVSTALARGIVDSENAKRHGLDGENIAKNCELVGLGELAMHLHKSTKVYQF